MKRIHAVIVAALMILSARAASAGETKTDVVTFTTAADGSIATVIDTVTTPYGTTTITWLADANLAASLSPGSPLRVDGINPDGSMSLSSAVAFIDKLNTNKYMGIDTWTLPTTNTSDTSCDLKSDGGKFGYSCGTPSGTDTPNPGYPYSEMAGLFYNVLGGTAGNPIQMVHNPT